MSNYDDAYQRWSKDWWRRRRESLKSNTEDVVKHDERKMVLLKSADETKEAVMNIEEKVARIMNLLNEGEVIISFVVDNGVEKNMQHRLIVTKTPNVYNVTYFSFSEFTGKIINRSILNAGIEAYLFQFIEDMYEGQIADIDISLKCTFCNNPATELDSNGLCQSCSKLMQETKKENEQDNAIAIPIMTLVREILMRKGVLYAEAQRIVEELDTRLNETSCQWIETSTGKTFRVTFTPKEKI